MEKKEDRYLTPIHTITSHVIGRDHEINLIHTGFFDKNHMVIVLSGTGGIGKTAIAMKYMDKHESSFDKVAWITVHDILTDALFAKHSLLGKLDLRSKVDDCINRRENDEAFELIFHELSSLGKTLLVLDNANNNAELIGIRKFLHNKNLYILITSRSNLNGWQCINVDALPAKEAVSLFKYCYQNNNISDKKIEEFLNKFSCLTLLIELIAKSAHQNGINFQELCTLYEDQNMEELVFNGAAIPPIVHNQMLDEPRRMTLHEYIDFTFRKIVDLSEDEIAILKIFSIAPRSKAFAPASLEEIFIIMGMHYNLNRLNILHEKGWLIRENNSKTVIDFKMHPVIKKFVLKKFNIKIGFAEPLIVYANFILDNQDPNLKIKLTKELQRQWQEFKDHMIELFFEPDLIGT